jgi:two-component system sensor histidine kinase YesM
MKILYTKVLSSVAIFIILITVVYLFLPSFYLFYISLIILLSLECFLLKAWFSPYIKLQKFLEKDELNNDVNVNINNLITDDLFLQNFEKYEIRKSNSLNKNVLMSAREKESKLLALQRQINPHFLYNTLETIRGQALIDDNEDIANMSETLACFFRYSISRSGDLVQIKDEFDNLDNYIRIQNYRFNNRFNVEYIIDEEDKVTLKYYVPKLIIQPIVENAINHGLKDITDNAKIDIEIILSDNNIIITISDNGVGIDDNKLTQINSELHGIDYNKTLAIDKKSNGIALYNIQKRIQLIFGNEYGINVYSTINYGTDVELIVPIIKERLSFID